MINVATSPNLRCSQAIANISHNIFESINQRKTEAKIINTNNAWEQRELGTVTQEFKSGNSLKADKISESGKYPVYGGNGLRGYTSNYNHDGEFALIGRQGALCGNMNYSIGKAYFTEHAVVVEANEKNNTRFIYYMLDTMNLGQYSDQSAQPGLAVNKLIKLENMFPRKEEQVWIGNYFQSLDHLITLHQRKLGHVKDLKKSMLQKMFPKNGELYPEVRFPGFTAAWEQRKLGEVFEQTANFVNPNEKEIELWSLTVEDGLTSKTERYNREFLVKKDNNFKEVRPGEIVYNPMNMTLGAVGYNGMAKSVAVSGYYTTMITKKGHDSYYINTWLKSPQAISLYKTFATGSLIEKQRVQFSTLSIIPATFPEYEEQAKIGQYFSNLDHLITLHQRELDHLQLLKKGMLQQMFV